MVDLGEEHGFIDTGGVFKRDEFHGVSILGPDRLSGHLPADGGDRSADMFTEIFRL